VRATATRLLDSFAGMADRERFLEQLERALARGA